MDPRNDSREVSQGNWHALAPIGGTTFDTAQSPVRSKSFFEKLMK
jgi:hypothetical protein